jgi:hypothetical protein
LPGSLSAPLFMMQADVDAVAVAKEPIVAIAALDNVVTVVADEDIG